MDKKKQKEVCIECEGKTDDYYPVSTNRGRVFRCTECHEQWVRNSVKIYTSNASLNTYEGQS